MILGLSKCTLMKSLRDAGGSGKGESVLDIIGSLIYSKADKLPLLQRRSLEHSSLNYIQNPSSHSALFPSLSRICSLCRRPQILALRVHE